MEGKKDGELGVSCALFFLGILLTYRSIFTRERGRPSFLILLLHFLQFFFCSDSISAISFHPFPLAIYFPTRFLCSREPNACFTPGNHHLQLHPFIFSHTLFTVYSSLIHEILYPILRSLHPTFPSHLPTFHSHPPPFPLIFTPYILISPPFPLSSSHLSYLPLSFPTFPLIFPTSLSSSPFPYHLPTFHSHPNSRTPPTLILPSFYSYLHTCHISHLPRSSSFPSTLLLPTFLTPSHLSFNLPFTLTSHLPFSSFPLPLSHPTFHSHLSPFHHTYFYYSLSPTTYHSHLTLSHSSSHLPLSPPTYHSHFTPFHTYLPTFYSHLPFQSLSSLHLL